MDLTVASEENLKFILNELSNKLNVANRILMDKKHYTLEKYDDIKNLYDLVTSRNQLTLDETNAFIDELSRIRNDN